MSRYIYPRRVTLGSSTAEKASRYSLMGLASIGVLWHYLDRKEYLLAGLYSIMTLGYFATASDYREEA